MDGHNSRPNSAKTGEDQPGKPPPVPHGGPRVKLNLYTNNGHTIRYPDNIFDTVKLNNATVLLLKAEDNKQKEQAEGESSVKNLHQYVEIDTVQVDSATGI